MSGIARRAVYASQLADGLHYHDWSSVVTGIGRCVEPFVVNARPTQTAHVTDEMNRVDDVLFIDPGRHSAVLSDGDDLRLHGGVLSPTG